MTIPTSNLEHLVNDGSEEEANVEEDEENIEENLSESQRVQFVALQLTKRIRAFVNKTRGTRAINDYVSAFLDTSEYCHLRQRPNDLQTALTLLKVEMQKETLRTVQGTNTANSVNVTTSDSNNINSSPTNVKNNIETLFSLCGVESTSTNASSFTTILSIDEEIGLYLSFVNGPEQVKFDRFWTDHENRLPIMSDVVRRVNIIPESSVPCESTFSIAGYIRRKQRYLLSSTALRYSLVLKDRHKLELLKH